MNTKATKGFTLLELLIVIAILAVLTTVVVLVLNPAEYLAQARDSQRISDLSTLNSAVALYISTASPITLSCGAASSSVCTGGTTSSTADAGTALCTSINSSTAISGTGWVNINFAGLAGGSPISREPIDPTNNATYHYAFGCSVSATTYKLAGVLESVKYGPTGQNLAGKDGGVSAGGYEIGTDLTLFN